MQSQIIYRFLNFLQEEEEEEEEEKKEEQLRVKHTHKLTRQTKAK